MDADTLSAPLLSLQNLSVAYGRRLALDDVSLSMDSKALGLLGPNGAGKSTLIRALLGLAPIATGEAALCGRQVRNEGRRIRELIGYMPEHEAYLAGMTPVRFLRFMGEMCGLSARAAMERAHETLFYVGLGEGRYRPIETLSYGLRQKVRLAQALIHGPQVLILDEPTNGLDPQGREEMLSLIRDMVAQSHSKVLFSSHLLKDIESCCDDVVVLKQGRCVAAGNIEAMRETSHNLYELRVKGDCERFIAALGEMGCECRLSDRNALRVVTPDGVGPGDFFRIAQDLQAQIRHFYAKRDSLEDIFLKALEADSANGANGANRGRPDGMNHGDL